MESSQFFFLRQLTFSTYFIALELEKKSNSLLTYLFCAPDTFNWIFRPGFDSLFPFIDALSDKKIRISMGLLVISLWA